MKRMIAAAAVFIILALVLAATPAAAATTVSQANSNAGGFEIVTLTLTADGSGGAVSGKTINLPWAVAGSPKTVYFYYIETIPGSGAAAPNAYTVTLTDADGGTVCALAARSTSAKEYADAAEDLPNYWPATGNLTLAVSDIGASNSTVIRLIFIR